MNTTTRIIVGAAVATAAVAMGAVVMGGATDIQDDDVEALKSLPPTVAQDAETETEGKLSETQYERASVPTLVKWMRPELDCLPAVLVHDIVACLDDDNMLALLCVSTAIHAALATTPRVVRLDVYDSRAGPGLAHVRAPPPSNEYVVGSLVRYAWAVGHGWVWPRGYAACLVVARAVCMGVRARAVLHLQRFCGSVDVAAATPFAKTRLCPGALLEILRSGQSSELPPRRASGDTASRLGCKNVLFEILAFIGLGNSAHHMRTVRRKMLRGNRAPGPFSPPRFKDVLLDILAFVGLGVNNYTFYSARHLVVQRKMQQATAFMRRASTGAPGPAHRSPKKWAGYSPPAHLCAHDTSALKTHNLAMGDAVVCRDNNEVLCRGYIVACGHHNTFRVKYLAWGARFSEWKTEAEITGRVRRPDGELHYYWKHFRSWGRYSYKIADMTTSDIDGSDVLARAILCSSRYVGCNADFDALINVPCYFCGHLRT